MVKTSRKKRSVWSKLKIYAVPIGLGLSAFIVNIVLLERLSAPTQNLFNWFIGLSLVASVVVLIVDSITGFKLRI